MEAGERRQARERALSLLYEAEAKAIPVDEVLRQLAIEPEGFARQLVEGVGDNRERIDSLITRFAIGWEIDRMPAVDRAILRLAVYELLDRPEIPVAVAISEAVELAKRYSTEESGRFVNGVLSSVAAHSRLIDGA